MKHVSLLMFLPGIYPFIQKFRYPYVIVTMWSPFLWIQTRFCMKQMRKTGNRVCLSPSLIICPQDFVVYCKTEGDVEVVMGIQSVRSSVATRSLLMLDSFLLLPMASLPLVPSKFHSTSLLSFSYLFLQLSDFDHRRGAVLALRMKSRNVTLSF